MDQEFGRPRSLLDNKVFSYCPGCGHGIAHRLVASVIDKLNIQNKTIGVAYIGCGGLIYNYINCDMISPLHGRAPAVATGIKRSKPENVVFTYQGDGDLAGIGTSEIIHTAARGEMVTVIFINNAVYGMTGGQMAPTTLLGQVTTSTTAGRRSDEAGYPVKVAEMMALFDGVAYVERVPLDKAKNIMKAQRAVELAFSVQIEKIGMGFVELLAACPTNLSMKPNNAMNWVGNEMTKVFVPGVYKNRLKHFEE